MAKDDTEFEKLLKEAREWDARDRARHKPFGMDDDGTPDSFASRPRAPVVTIEELQKRETQDLKAGAQPPALPPQKPAASIKVALKTAMKQAKAQQATERAKATKSGGWGWIIWALVIGYFVFKRYLH